MGLAYSPILTAVYYNLGLHYLRIQDRRIYTQSCIWQS